MTKLNLTLNLVFAALLFATPIQASGLTDPVVTTQCASCVGKGLAIYDGVVYQVVERDGVTGESIVDAISLLDNSVTNLVTGDPGETWWVADVAGQFIALGFRIPCLISVAFE
jgi:hypothetical protein